MKTIKLVARRCSICGTNWPDTSEFIDCPRCNMMTRRYASEPMDLFEAMSLKRHIEFDDYFENEWLPDHPEAASHLPSVC